MLCLYSRQFRQDLCRMDDRSRTASCRAQCRQRRAFDTRAVLDSALCRAAWDAAPSHEPRGVFEARSPVPESAVTADVTPGLEQDPICAIRSRARVAVRVA